MSAFVRRGGTGGLSAGDESGVNKNQAAFVNPGMKHLHIESANTVPAEPACERRTAALPVLAGEGELNGPAGGGGLISGQQDFGRRRGKRSGHIAGAALFDTIEKVRGIGLC